MKVKCIDNYLKENVITEGKEYLVKSVGIGKYVIINDNGKIACINQSRFTVVEDDR